MSIEVIASLFLSTVPVLDAPMLPLHCDRQARDDFAAKT
jgi:hypothetical protein